MLRVLFFYLNRPLFHSSSQTEIILAFLNGIRYDLAAIAMLNLALFVLYLIPMRRLEGAKRIVLGLIFTLVNGFALSCNVIDLEYFHFTGKRLTMDIFCWRATSGTRLRKSLFIIGIFPCYRSRCIPS